MRFLHTADLHIGKRLLDMNLAEDQRHILHEIAQIAKEKKCDAVFIAGDIYDKPTPSAEAMGIFDTFVSELVLGGVSVYAISGNHDSGDRVNYLSGLIEDKGIIMEGKYNGTLSHHTVTDEYGDLDIYLLPFIKPLMVKGFFPEQEITTYDEAVRAVLSEVDKTAARRRIILSHQFVMGASTCESEELAIGGLDCISHEVYDGFDYVALGHIHGPQRIKRETLRYSGTPLKYSFSEASHKKSVTFVEMKEKGEVKVEQIRLHPSLDLQVKRGSMEALMEEPYTEDYIQAIVTDEEVAPDARISLFTKFPNMLKFGVENSKTSEEWQISAEGDFEQKHPLEMMEDFYRFQNNRTELSVAQRSLLIEVLESMGGDAI